MITELIEPPKSLPPVANTLTLSEALLVADQIRTAPRGFTIDRDYWPWVIEELVRKLEEVEAKPKKGK